MSIALWCWVGLGVAVTLVWLIRLAAMRTVIARQSVLSDRSLASHDLQAAQKPAQAEARGSLSKKVSVVVAAKDEEANIEACVTSLVAQDYPDFEVIAVDDRSTDRTPAILARLQRQFPDRLRVLTIRNLSEGWFGKCHAMRHGVDASTGDWFLFTDADCRFTSPSAVRLALDEATAHKVDLLTIIPQLDAPTAWERMIQPVCSLILIFWFQPDHVNDPEKCTAYANGAFMLMRRDCYDGVGGHGAVRCALNEDIRLARLVKHGGWRLRVVQNDGLYRTRMYPTFADAWRGWSRIFCGALDAPWRVGVAILFVFVFSVVPWASLLSSLGWMLTAASPWISPWRWVVLVWAAAVVAQQLCLWRVYRVMQQSRPWSFLYTPGAVVAAGMLVNALLKILGATTTTWRSTTYRGDRTLSDAAAEPSKSASGHPAPEPLARILP